MSKAGDVLRDLYRDLRDRRLLPVVIVLAVAIVAVPILLGSGSSQTPPTPPADAAVAVKGSAGLSPVVLADVPGLRDYRKRLDRFQSRDPFKQQLTGSRTAQGGKGNLQQTGSSTTSASASTSGPTGSTDVTTSPSQAPADTQASTDSGAPSSPGSSNSGGKGGKDGKGGKPEDRVIETTIDVRVGPAGATKVLKGVESLQFLPGEKRPVVQFVQGDRDGTHAAFVVSPAVTETEGDGRCDPGPNDCQFVLMKKGDLRTFVYGDKLETYRLQILAIHRELVPLSGSGR
jgi:hypothetical protein